MRKFKHLTYTDRLVIEAMVKAGASKKEIAARLQVHLNTIYNELKRGAYTRLSSELVKFTAYSPDIAERRYRDNLTAKGACLKIGNDHKLAKYLEQKIAKEKYSPAAALAEIRRKGLQFSVSIKSPNTIYSYIDKGVFSRLTNKDLPIRGNKKRGYRQVRTAANPPQGESIEKRPEEIAARSAFGHWEMDTVVSKRGVSDCLLVLTERLTRNEIIYPLQNKTAAGVVKALDTLERKYGKLFYKVFRSITVDNGSEFADCEGMERSKYRKDKRTKIFYCHPYSAYERGSNENINILIRRHFPKGTDFSKVSKSAIQRVQDWINDYPRKIFNFYSSGELFDACLNSLL
jgi:IS30 family transposase